MEASTSTIEFVRLRDAEVRCCQLTCERPASFAVIAPLSQRSMRLYEMQPYCVAHYLQMEKAMRIATQRRSR